MVKRTFLFAIFLSVLMFAYSVSIEKVMSKGNNWNPMTPILDVSVDSSLSLQFCKGFERAIDKEQLIRNGLSEKDVKKIRSQKVTQIHEEWRFSHGVIEICRWYLATPEDAAISPAILLAGAYPTGFPGWSKTPDIGDRTCWLATGPDIVYFTKGSVLVRVFINSLTPDREYTKKIAKSIEKRL